MFCGSYCSAKLVDRIPALLSRSVSEKAIFQQLFRPGAPTVKLFWSFLLA